MEHNPEQFVYYKQSRFSAKLPADRLYTPSHFWLAQVQAGVWQVGLTRFASRMLGDLVEHGFQVQPGEKVTAGQVIGWVEGFKAVTDLYCVASGEFLGGNPALEQDVTLTDSDPHGQGWLYQVRGEPDPASFDVHQYVNLLDATIEKLKRQTGGESGDE